VCALENEKQFGLLLLQIAESITFQDLICVNLSCQTGRNYVFFHQKGRASVIGYKLKVTCDGGNRVRRVELSHRSKMTKE